MFDILILLLCNEIEHYVSMNTKSKKRGLCLRQVDINNNSNNNINKKKQQKNKQNTANVVNIFLTYLFFAFGSTENIL